MIIEEKQLYYIEGGINITGTMISSLIKGIDTLLNLGRSLGTAIRRIGTGKICSM